MDDRRLTAVRVDFARTLTGDFSIENTLDLLVERVLGVLPVTGAGVLLMDGERDHHVIAATDDVILRIETLQVELGEGPCLEAYRTGRPVIVRDLSGDAHFPGFSPRAAQGLGAVFSFPLRLDEAQIGALELYTRHPSDLSAQDRRGAQTLADVMAAYLFNAQARHGACSEASRPASAWSCGRETRWRDCPVTSSSWSARRFRPGAPPGAIAALRRSAAVRSSSRRGAWTVNRARGWCPA